MQSFKVGDVVFNLGQTARVVGFFAAADGQPCDDTGRPILKSERGGKWVADPAKCRLLTADELRQLATQNAAGRRFAGLRGRI